MAKPRKTASRKSASKKTKPAKPRAKPAGKKRGARRGPGAPAPRALAGVASIGASAGYKGVADALNVSGRTARRWLQKITAGQVPPAMAANIAAAYKQRQAPIGRSRGYRPSARGRVVSKSTRAKISAGVKRAWFERKNTRALKEMTDQGIKLLKNPRTWFKPHHILRTPETTLAGAVDAITDAGLTSFADIYQTPSGLFEIVVWDPERKKKGGDTASGGGAAAAGGDSAPGASGGGDFRAPGLGWGSAGGSDDIGGGGGGGGAGGAPGDSRPAPEAVDLTQLSPAQVERLVELDMIDLDDYPDYDPGEGEDDSDSDYKDVGAS